MAKCLICGPSFSSCCECLINPYQHRMEGLPLRASEVDKPALWVTQTCNSCEAGLMQIPNEFLTWHHPTCCLLLLLLYPSTTPCEMWLLGYYADRISKVFERRYRRTSQRKHCAEIEDTVRQLWSIKWAVSVRGWEMGCLMHPQMEHKSNQFQTVLKVRQ